MMAKSTILVDGKEAEAVTYDTGDNNYRDGERDDIHGALLSRFNGGGRRRRRRAG